MVLGAAGGGWVRLGMGAFAALPSLCGLRGPLTMLLGLGILLDGLVCQVVLLRIDQKLLNGDYAFGIDAIQPYKER